MNRFVTVTATARTSMTAAVIMRPVMAARVTPLSYCPCTGAYGQYRPLSNYQQQRAPQQPAGAAGQQSTTSTTATSAADKANAAYERVKDTVSDLSDKAKEQANQAAEQAAEIANSMGKKVGAKANAAGEAIKHKGQEVAHNAKSSVHMDRAKDPNRPLTERVAEGAAAAKEKVAQVFSGGQKEVAKEKAKRI